MPNAITKFALVLLAAFFLSACDDEKSISESNAGTSVGDSGKQSAQYAGLYSGTMDLKYTGDDVNGSSSFISSMTVNTNGTVSLTIDSETVGGTINNNQVTVNLRITQTEDGIKCTGTAKILAAVVGNKLSGPVTGDATCTLLTAKRSATMTGTINLFKKS